MSGFRKYRRSQIAELRTWEPGDDMAGVSISAEDARAGSPKAGDMIVRNPKNHADQWLVAAAYFADNFEPLEKAEFERDWREKRRKKAVAPAPRREECARCHGHGATEADEITPWKTNPCPRCDGSGFEPDLISVDEISAQDREPR